MLGLRKRLLIINYHRVLSEPDPLRENEVTAVDFAMQLGGLARFFNVMPLARAVAALRDGALPRRAVAVTFDDGYADNVTVALPILLRLGVPATFFITVGFLDGGRMWNDAITDVISVARGTSLDLRSLDMGVLDIATVGARKHAVASLLAEWKYLPVAERNARVSELTQTAGSSLPPSTMMTTVQVQQLAAAGMEVGAHTLMHPILARLPDAEARHEIVASKHELERITGREVAGFAYPNGRPERDFKEHHRRMVADAGYRFAVTTEYAAATRQVDPLLLPRIGTWDRQVGRFLLRMLRFF